MFCKLNGNQIYLFLLLCAQIVNVLIFFPLKVDKKKNVNHRFVLLYTLYWILLLTPAFKAFHPTSCASNKLVIGLLLLKGTL